MAESGLHRLAFILTLVLAVPLVVAAGAAAAPAPPTYEVVDIGSLAPTVTGCSLGMTFLGPSVANAINDDGVVVGQYQYHCDNSRRAFIYRPGSGFGTLRTRGFFDSDALAINGDGTVAGWRTVSGFSGWHPIAITDTSMADGLGQFGTSVDLEPLGLPPGYMPQFNTTGRALDINDRGDIVGQAITSDGSTHGFLRRGGAMVDLGVPSPYSTSSAAAINERAVIALNASSGDGDQAAFVGKPGTFTNIGGFGGLATVASDLNQKTVVGWSLNPSGEQRAFAFAGATMHDVGPGRALGINNRGDIVGTTDSPFGSPFVYNPNLRAFVVVGGQRYDLDDLLPQGSPWKIMQASEINNAGQIVGIGTTAGLHRAVLLNPTDAG